MLILEIGNTVDKIKHKMKEYLYKEIIRSLNKKELRKLETFISSSYHNRNPETIELFLHLSQNSYELASAGISEESFGKIFKKPGITKYHFNRLVSEFTDLLYQFLIFESLRNDHSERNLYLLKILQERKTFRNAKRAFNELTEQLKESKNIDEDYYHKKIKTEKFKNTSKFVELVYSNSKELQDVSGYIDLNFIFQKLQSFIMMVKHNNETSYSIDYNYTFKDAIVEFIRDNETRIKKDHVLIYSYYLALQMMGEKDNDHYFNTFKKYVFSNVDRISIGYLKDLLLDYKNNCDDRIYLNQKKYGNEIYKVYELMDEKNMILLENTISHIDFMNAVLTALALKKRTWALYFYEKYKGTIDQKHREDVLHLVRANLLFYDRRFSESLLELNKISSKQFYYYLRIRLIRIKIYFEFNESESVNYIIDSVKHYIKRNRELIGSNFMIVDNFLNTVRKLQRLKFKTSLKEYKNLKNYIKREESIYSKDWLLQKTGSPMLRSKVDNNL